MVVPSPSLPSSNNQEPAEVEFATYETSVAKLERARWKIQSPIPWNWGNEKDAIKFITEPSQIGGWINSRFEVFIDNNTAGSAILETPDSISFVAQTPKDDKLPFFALSLTQNSTESHQRDAEWKCLLFVRPKSRWDSAVEGVLFHDPFPHDYLDPVPPDMMMLPVALLLWQVNQVLREVNGIKERLSTNRDPSMMTIEEPESKRREFFRMREKNLHLRRRWEFASELAKTLIETFGILERRYLTEDDVGGYSPSLTANVVSQQATLKSLIHELDTTHAMMEYQQNKFDEDIRVAVQQRDSVSLRIIALVTLVFLPATFIATVFSMSIFNWHAGQPDDDPTNVSSWIWLYFVLSIVLTLIIVLVWKALAKFEGRNRNRK
ncbi:hypothetical protein QQX98_009756 [Neonectria punicea]|uniref:Uncharacterized protein n=1 Tax=Neonectria punicea TaxID=979145 RepID=A0ABR1GRU5_9HYPO